jgi:hypothetical protein
VNAGDRSRWLDPSPPIPVDGEEPRVRRPLSPPPPREEPAADEPEGDPGAEDDSA